MNFAKIYPNLALKRLGLKIISCSDQFFAPPTRLFNQADAVFIPDKFDDHGKWMDGWETRRRRVATPDHDWLEFKLGSPAKLHGVNFCTHHFTGNYPPYALLEVNVGTASKPKWQSITKKSKLKPDSDNLVAITKKDAIQHMRLKIFPDGGLARLKLYGLFINNKKPNSKSSNLVSILEGSKVIAFSDAHFGHPTNMLMPDAAINMGDGWETARRRGPGFDWSIIELGAAGIINDVTIETKFFKGNYPHHFSLQYFSGKKTSNIASITKSSSKWQYLIKDTKLAANATKKIKINNKAVISYVRLNIFPDGGISRIKLNGIVK